MTTDELVEKLKGLGVSDEQAEGFRGLHLKANNPGGQIRIPVFTPDNVFYTVCAKLTGEDKDYVPEWNSVVKMGETV
jgi:hypothetical protein